MKNLIATTAIFAAMATTAVADTVRARITHVEPRYETVYRTVPRQECKDVEVPVYGTVQGGASGGDVLTGMIIGGLLGKGITGKDDGAAAGAVMGGVIAADKGSKRQVVTGYRTERQCYEVLTREEFRDLKNYFIRFEWNGVKGSAYTYNQYKVGDKIRANVSISAQ